MESITSKRYYWLHGVIQLIIRCVGKRIYLRDAKFSRDRRFFRCTDVSRPRILLPSLSRARDDRNADRAGDRHAERERLRSGSFSSMSRSSEGNRAERNRGYT
ncbi:hypothetical protein PUN28_013194 [Cardiocondyla obscurior]|uniref:Uncharacterized protein n=1 Tax=Cardiocondyla obscurior TaxID=286306 RepID=A0AAW2FCB4_9HYME